MVPESTSSSRECRWDWTSSKRPSARLERGARVLEVGEWHVREGCSWEMFGGGYGRPWSAPVVEGRVGSCPFL